MSLVSSTSFPRIDLKLFLSPAFMLPLPFPLSFSPRALALPFPLRLTTPLHEGIYIINTRVCIPFLCLGEGNGEEMKVGPWCVVRGVGHTNLEVRGVGHTNLHTNRDWCGERRGTHQGPTFISSQFPSPRHTQGIYTCICMYVCVYIHKGKECVYWRNFFYS